MCFDIFPFTGIRFLAYPLSYPPPCQSPRKSAPIETTTSDFEKSYSAKALSPKISSKASNVSEQETASYTTCLAVGYLAINSSINISVDGLAKVPVKSTICPSDDCASAKDFFTAVFTSSHEASFPSIFAFFKRKLSYIDKTEA